MPSFTIEYHTESERLMLEQAIAFVGQLRRVAAEAPEGTVLDACERAALDDGRRLLRDTLAGALQHRVAAADAPKNATAPAARGGMPAGF